MAKTEKLVKITLSVFVLTMILITTTGKVLAADTPATGLSIPGFISKYKISAAGMSIGETTRSLTLNPGKLHIFESITRPIGIGRILASGQVVERSEWQFKDGKLLPIKYTYFDSSSDKDRNVNIQFNWDNKTITNIINGEPWKMTLEDDTQDKLLYQVRLMHDLSMGIKTLNYPVADGGKLKYYNLEIIGNEAIKTDFGKFDTLRIRRIHSKRVTTFWCAKSLNYLPVRIEQRYDNNPAVTATLVSLTGIR